jgi:hypothetical protein
MSKFFATDKLEDPANIKWILNKKHHNDQRKIDVIITLQTELTRLKAEYNSAGINARRKLKTDINAIEVRLAKLRANMTFYVESNHTHTMQILGEKWYRDKVRTMKDNPYELKVAIRNEDPDRPEDGFYPDFDSNIHTYEDLLDYNPQQPLIIAPDYQHSVSPIPIAQIGKLPGEARDSLNYIDEVYTKAPQGLEAAVQKLCDNYITHPKKVIYFIYDHTAKGKRLDAEMYYKIVVDVLKKNRWKVIEVYTGKAPLHYQKFIDTQSWLQNKDGKGMAIRINKKRS